MPQVTISHKFIHEAPRKLRLIADTIRGLPAEVAVAELATLSQFASQTVRKAVLSAIATAKQQGLASPVFISAIMVDEGPKLRRFIPMSKGRSQRILKRMSHIQVSLTDEPVKIASGRQYKREIGQTKAKVVPPATVEGSK